MKNTVSCEEFVQSFRDAGRDGHFGYYGKIALFDYLEEQELDFGEEMELDVVALCCDYTEYDDILAFKEDYPGDEFLTIDDIKEQTQVIELGEQAFIVANF